MHTYVHTLPCYGSIEDDPNSSRRPYACVSNRRFLFTFQAAPLRPGAGGPSRCAAPPTPPTRTTRPQPSSPHISRRPTPPTSPRTNPRTTSNHHSSNSPTHPTSSSTTSINGVVSPTATSPLSNTNNNNIRSTPTTPTRGVIKQLPTQVRSNSPLSPSENAVSVFTSSRADSPGSGIPRRIPFSTHRGTSPNNGGNFITGGALSRGISPSGSTSIPVIRNNASTRGTSPNCATSASPTTGSSRGVIYRGNSMSRGTSPNGASLLNNSNRGVSPSGANNNGMNMRGVSPCGLNFRGTSPNGSSSNNSSHPLTTNYRGNSPNGLNYRGYSPNGANNRRMSPIYAAGGTGISYRDPSPTTNVINNNTGIIPSSSRGTSPNSCNSSSNPRGSSPSGGFTNGTTPRGTSPNGSSSVRGTSPTGTSSFRGTSPGSRCSSTSGISEEVLRGRVRRAVRARLYLLHQPGPNSFSVGGDSPTHKYKVIIGPQVSTSIHTPSSLTTHIYLYIRFSYMIRITNGYLATS